jgi:hypothetical protein
VRREGLKGMVYGTLIATPVSVVLAHFAVPDMPWHTLFRIGFDLHVIALPIFALLGWMSDCTNHSRKWGRTNCTKKEIAYLEAVEKEIEELTGVRR